MPNKNGTGPNNQGPKTGRGLGSCSTKDSTEQPRGIGRGRVRQRPRRGPDSRNN